MLGFQAEAAGRSRRWAERPIVSVIIPVFNKWELTRSCLQSLLLSDSAVPLQIVVVDDGSTDETAMELAGTSFVETIRNDANYGYLRSCNRGATVAKGEFLLFLNNDTVIDAVAISALLDRISGDTGIGIVGSKLLFPDGSLQEAGGIIWSDARGWNYGRNDDAKKSQYNFVRDVDYVSGAALMVRAELFRAVGGFDERFAPAYYEDADLCFTVRASGKRIVYEPASIVFHYEGGTSGTDLASGAKRHQVANQSVFYQKWKTVLERDHFEPDARNVEVAARARGGHEYALLVIESTLPRYDRDAAGSRLRSLMLGLAAAGTRVVFYPDDLERADPYASDLQSHGIEVVYADHSLPFRWRDYLSSAVRNADVVWISRPGNLRHYLPAIRELSTIPIVYDTVDLHYLRLQRQAEVQLTETNRQWTDLRHLEITCALAADATAVVSEFERKLLRSAGAGSVYVIPTIHDLVETLPRNYFATQGLLFIGGFKHDPNVDAARWIVEDIMPHIWAEIPDVTLTLLGSDPPVQVRALASERVRVPGYIHDVTAEFRSARVFVAPLRYGAGIKGKIGQALSYRLPVVSTTVGAEGFNFRPGIDAKIADDAESFANAVVDIYNNVEAWSALSYRAGKVLEQFSTDAVIRHTQQMLHDVLTASPSQGVGRAQTI